MIADQEAGYDFRFSVFFSQTAKINLKIIAQLNPVHFLSKPVNLPSNATLGSAIWTECLNKSQSKNVNYLLYEVVVCFCKKQTK